MSPFGARAVWVQRWNGSPLIYGAGSPGTPSSRSTLPSSSRHLRAKWAPPSVRAIDSSGPMWTPCARGYCPSPPGAQKIALAVEYYHRVVTAIEAVDVVVLVDA